MTTQEQIQALKEHNIKISIGLPDGVCAYQTPKGKVFLVTWIVEEGLRSGYDPGYIEITIGDVTYERNYNEEWYGVPEELLAAFDKSDLRYIIFDDTTEGGMNLFMSVFGLGRRTEVYDLDECLYNLNVCTEADLHPKYDFIEISNQYSLSCRLICSHCNRSPFTM